MAKQIVSRHNVCAAKEYTTSQGEVKTQWVNLGTSVTFDDGSFLININALPMGNWWAKVLNLYQTAKEIFEKVAFCRCFSLFCCFL